MIEALRISFIGQVRGESDLRPRSTWVQPNGAE